MEILFNCLVIALMGVPEYLHTSMLLMDRFMIFFMVRIIMRKLCRSKALEVYMFSKLISVPVHVY